MQQVFSIKKPRLEKFVIIIKGKAESKQGVMKSKRWKGSKERLDPLIPQFLISLRMDVGCVLLKLKKYIYLMFLSGKDESENNFVSITNIPF